MINTPIKHIFTLAAVGLLGASVASAAPTYDTFAPLPQLIAGGTPNKNVATTVSGGLTLGLGAQQRYQNAVVTDNGAGTYYATTGANAGDLLHPIPTGVSPYKFLGSTWNFDFYIQNLGTASAYTYSIEYGLAGGTVYSFDPTLDADAAKFFNITTPGAYQDSQNLMFGTFGGAVNGFAGSFDPNADATYEFLLKATPVSGGPVVQSGITVVVGNGSAVPDAGSTLALMGAAFVGIAGLRRKFNA